MKAKKYNYDNVIELIELLWLQTFYGRVVTSWSVIAHTSVLNALVQAV